MKFRRGGDLLIFCSLLSIIFAVVIQETDFESYKREEKINRFTSYIL